jgi:hypothetical protein
MSTLFEFRLIGADAPDGKLDADQLLSIVQSLKDTATRLGRMETTDAATVGRPSRQLERVAKLRIGMEKGSTRITVERSIDESSLDFDLDDEAAVDVRFQELVEGIGRDERPGWVTDSQAAAARELVTALRKAAPEVEFKVGDSVRSTFKTVETHPETWKPHTTAPVADDTITLVGRLEKVDIKSHDFRVRDDVGNAYSLPKVANDLSASRLIGSYVSVSGAGERDARGRVVAIRGADIVGVPDPLDGSRIPEAITVEEILASASGLELGGIHGLSDAEADTFFEAMGL